MVINYASHLNIHCTFVGCVCVIRSQMDWRVFFFGYSGFFPHQNRLSAKSTTLGKLDLDVDCVSFQSAGIDFGLEATARLLTLLDPWNHGYINYT